MATNQVNAHYRKNKINAKIVTSLVILKKTAEHAPRVGSLAIGEKTERKKINALTAASMDI